MKNFNGIKAIIHILHEFCIEYVHMYVCMYVHNKTALYEIT